MIVGRRTVPVQFVNGIRNRIRSLIKLSVTFAYRMVYRHIREQDTFVSYRRVGMMGMVVGVFPSFWDPFSPRHDRNHLKTVLETFLDRVYARIQVHLYIYGHCSSRRGREDCSSPVRPSFFLFSCSYRFRVAPSL